MALTVQKATLHAQRRCRCINMSTQHEPKARSGPFACTSWPNELKHSKTSDDQLLLAAVQRCCLSNDACSVLTTACPCVARLSSSSKGSQSQRPERIMTLLLGVPQGPRSDASAALASDELTPAALHQAAGMLLYFASRRPLFQPLAVWLLPPRPFSL